MQNCFLVAVDIFSNALIFLSSTVCLHRAAGWCGPRAAVRQTSASKLGVIQFLLETDNSSGSGHTIYTVYTIQSTQSPTCSQPVDDGTEGTLAPQVVVAVAEVQASLGGIGGSEQIQHFL